MNAWPLRGYFLLPILYVSVFCQGSHTWQRYSPPTRCGGRGGSRITCLALGCVGRHKGWATQNSLAVVTYSTPVQDGVYKFWPWFLESFCCKPKMMYFDIFSEENVRLNESRKAEVWIGIFLYFWHFRPIWVISILKFQSSFYSCPFWLGLKEFPGVHGGVGSVRDL